MYNEIHSINFHNGLMNYIEKILFYWADVFKTKHIESLISLLWIEDNKATVSYH